MALACLCGALVACTGASAANTDTASPFEAGITAYRAGDFTEALQLFLAARAQGADSDALLFNLGLTHYRLGDYTAARRTFVELRQRPAMAAVAEYHLGLVAAQVGQMDRASAHLRAAAAGDSVELRQLALTALERLTDRPSARALAAYASFGIGYDNNRNQISELIRIPGPEPESAYVEASGIVQYPLPRLTDTDVRASLFRRDYETDDDLDQSVMQLSLRRAWRPGAWRITLAGESDAAFLGGDTLLAAYGLSLEGVRRAGGSTLRLRYRPSDINAGSDYEYLDGQRHRADLSQEFPLGAFQFRAGYEVEANDRRDLAVGQQFFSQSPLRHGPFLRVSRTLTPSVALEINSAYRHSRFHGANRFFAGTTLQTERRVEDLIQWSLTAHWRIGPAWALRLDYRYTENHSSIETYDYSRDIVVLAVEWRY
jgi:hypothetical protein